MPKLHYLVWQHDVFVIDQYRFYSVIKVGISDPRTIQAWEQVSNETQE